MFILELKPRERIICVDQRVFCVSRRDPRAMNLKVPLEKISVIRGKKKDFCAVAKRFNKFVYI